MHGISRPTLLVVLAALAIVPSAIAQDPGSGPTTPAASTQADPTIDELAFFTTDHINDTPPEGCAVSVNILRLSDGHAVLRDVEGGSMLSTLRASPGLQVVVAGYRGWLGAVYDGPTRGAQGSHPGIQLPDDLQATYGSIYVLRKDPSASSGWDVASTVVGRNVYLGIDILPDGDTLLVATRTLSPISLTLGPPFQVEAYSLAEMIPLPASPDRTATHRLGPARGTVELADPVVGIVLDPGGTQAHLLTQGADAHSFPLEDEARLVVHTIDVPSMREVEPPIELPPWEGSRLPFFPPRAAISPDGRHLATTRGWFPAINVVDLSERRAWSIPIDRASAVMDVSFSHGAANHGLLALNVARPPDPSEVLPPPIPDQVRSEVAIAALQSQALVELGRGPASPGREAYFPAAIEWTADGARVVAGTAFRPVIPVTAPITVPMAVLLDVDDGGTRVTKRRDLLPCSSARITPYVVDILTGNGYQPTATPTPTASPTATPSPTPTATGTPSPTPTDVPTTSPPTRPLVPAYLPALSNQHCLPRAELLDVALVLDASTSMQLPSAGSDLVKFTAALDAAATFVDQLRLEPGTSTSDRVGVVGFNASAWTEIDLSPDRAAVLGALSRLQARIEPGTRLDLAIAQGAAALGDLSIGPGRRRVLILLTDGLPNDVPTPVSGGNQEDTVMRAAAVAKAAGITLYSIGLGRPDAPDPAERINRELLRGVASDPERYLETPDAAGLAAIYAEIARAIACVE